MPAGPTAENTFCASGADQPVEMKSGLDAATLVMTVVRSFVPGGYGNGFGPSPSFLNSEMHSGRLFWPVGSLGPTIAVLLVAGKKSLIASPAMPQRASPVGSVPKISG